ncbi:hypothetical protein EVAR_2867_1 [Eumeta japonica]|uniref:Uncharacterized protein n=1 Tax=Eumeta variegata TaxID=151549 RepID=A0A4C1T1P7_EUMVA|nr:hypothetical protein EVAR_2867_1 [Eumeta japonica]
MNSGNWYFKLKIKSPDRSQAKRTDRKKKDYYYTDKNAVCDAGTFKLIRDAYTQRSLSKYFGCRRKGNNTNCNAGDTSGAAG